MVTFFRRPQTPFVQSDNTQAPQSQWKLLAASDDNSSSHSLSVSTSSTGAKHTSAYPDGNDNAEWKPHGIIENGKDIDSIVQQPAQLQEPINNGNGHNDDHGNDHVMEDAGQHPVELEDGDHPMDEQEPPAPNSPLQVTHHPDWILLCGYFHESRVHRGDHQPAVIFLSTHLPGVRPIELSLHYAPGAGVLKLAGERATHKTYQKFERHFAIEERWLDVEKLVATLDITGGVLTLAVPLRATNPPAPVPISIVQASPLGLFRHRPDIQCWDIPVPGVAMRDLMVEYDHGQLKIVWRQMMTQTYFVRAIPLNTLQVDIAKCMAYLDYQGGGGPQHAVLTLVAPLRSNIPNYRTIGIQVLT